MVKMGVQYSLWGGSVMSLGTERHRQKYFDAIDQLKLPGRLTAQYVSRIQTTTQAALR